MKDRLALVGTALGVFVLIFVFFFTAFSLRLPMSFASVAFYRIAGGIAIAFLLAKLKYGEK